MQVSRTIVEQNIERAKEQLATGLGGPELIANVLTMLADLVRGPTIGGASPPLMPLTSAAYCSRCSRPLLTYRVARPCAWCAQTASYEALKQQVNSQDMSLTTLAAGELDCPRLFVLLPFEDKGRSILSKIMNRAKGFVKDQYRLVFLDPGGGPHPALHVSVSSLRSALCSHRSRLSHHLCPRSDRWRGKVRPRRRGLPPHAADQVAG